MKVTLAADERASADGVRVGKSLFSGFTSGTARSMRLLSRMQKFNDIKQENFYWFLKESEWRFNGGNHQQLLKQFRYWYKNAKD